MKVLVACEESQVVCKAFRERGHEAYSCDIIDCSGGHPEWHIKGDVLKVLNPIGLPYGGVGIAFHTADGQFHIVDGKWDLIIAHPPCTYMSAAGACRMYPQKGVLDEERYKKSQEAKEFFFKIMNADCEKIVIENPRPLKIVGLPEETQRIQPYEYALDESEYFTKLTYLWEKGVPPLVPLRKEKPQGTKPFVNAGSKTSNGEYRKLKGCKSSAKERSKTFFGIGRAMASQWG